MPCTDDVRDEALFGLKVLLIATHPIAFKGGALLLLGKWRITLLFDGWKAHLAVLPTKRKYKMATIEEQIKALEEEIFNTQKNNATEHHLGKLRPKKRARAQARSGAAAIRRRRGQKYYIKKIRRCTVDGGVPVVGKSTCSII